MIKELNISNTERTQCEVWTRVMGYHRPVSEFNTGKKGEYAERTPFLESRSLENCMAESAVA